MKAIEPWIRGTALVAPILLAGCMHARVEESREMHTQISEEEAIVILAKPQIEGAGAEDGFMDCVGDQLAEGARGIKVQGNDEFVDQMFPWFEPGTAPAKPEAVATLLARPGV